MEQSIGTSENALYKLECITDNPKYEGFAFVRDESIRGTDSLTEDFMPDDIATKGRAWTVTRMASIWVPQSVEGLVRPFNDYPCVNMLIPAFSRRAVEALRDFLEPNGELLPLVSSVGEYYVYNVTTVADILDHERSDIKWFNDRHVSALDIKRYECAPARLIGLSIFRLVEMSSSTYVTQVFVDRVREHHLEGFHFIKVWPLAKRRSWRDEDRKQKKKDTSVKTSRGRKSITGNTVVILLPTAKEKPSKAETEQVAKLMDELDALLYHFDPDPKAPYYGSLEGNDHHKGACRLFLSCPDADVLVEKLRPWLKGLSWPGRVSVVKRYGEYDDPKCREEAVDL